MSEILLPATLRSRLRERRMLLFAGAGLTMLAGGPSWSDLLLGLISRAHEEGIQLEGSNSECEAAAAGGTEQKLALAGHLRNRLREDQFGAYLRARMEELHPTETHRRLVGLNWSGFITTNYDTLLESAYQERFGKTLRVVTWQDTDELSRLNDIDGWILKLHGCLTRANTIVLDQTSFDHLFASGTALDALRGLFKRYSLLFSGYSLSDPDVMPELQKLTSLYSDSANRHYAILSQAGHSAGFWKRYLEDRYAVQTLLYDDSHGHEQGLLPLVDELTVQSSDPSRASRNKLLLLVKHLRRGSSNAFEDVLLVTNDVPFWGLPEGANFQSGSSLQKAYLLPTLEYTGQDSVAAAAEFADLTGLPSSAVRISNIGEEFHSVKFNPALRRETEYSFRFGTVQIDAHEWLSSKSMRYRDGQCEWMTLAELQSHEPTLRLNEDVLGGLVSRYGQELANLEYSGRPNVFHTRDPYARRASAYNALPWVSDAGIFNPILQSEWVGDAPGVLDLGCGTAVAASPVAARGLAYVGVERSESMLRVARASGCPGMLIHADFLHAPSQDHSGWYFVLKNVLHLISDLTSVLSMIADTWGTPRAIAVAETVSPSVMARAWVENLFRRLGLEYKRHFFARDELNEILMSDGTFSVSHSTYVEQRIDVEQWVESFEVGRDVQADVLTVIRGAPTAVKESMKIAEVSGRLTMLRLQHHLILTPR